MTTTDFDGSPLTIAQAQDRFMNGQCAAFACALWLELGEPSEASIVVLSDYDGEPFSEEDAFEFTHAYLALPDYDIDVCGRRTPAEMADHLNIETWSNDCSEAPAAFMAAFAGAEDQPLYSTPEAIASARRFIAANPSLYL